MQPPDPLPRVIFFQVQTPQAKTSCLVQIVQRHFLLKEPVLIIAEEDKALAYVDELLWKHTPTSFLPHSILEKPTEEWIGITKVKKNLNNARYAFNLCPTPLLIEGPFRTIYEFEDATSQSKKNLSQLRYDAYKQARYLIESHLIHQST